MKAGHNQTEIARILEVHKSTISRELRRNRGLCGYRPQQAEQLAVTSLYVHLVVCKLIIQ